MPVLRYLAFLLMALSAGRTLSADILAEALLSFPAETESVEYDNLAALRNLPNYNALRDRYAGQPLTDAKVALKRLGIQEQQVTEIVNGMSAHTFYGLVAGTFSRRASTKIPENQIDCSAGTTCGVFLEDSLAAFGPGAELKKILQSRQGIINRLSSNRDAVALLDNSDRKAHVRGVVFGSQLKSAIADLLRDQSGFNLDWSRFSSNISALGYSVKLDRKAHVGVRVECVSTTVAALLQQTVRALGSFSFENVQVSSAGKVVDLKLDAPIPAT